ncbi:MAG: ABC transporter permease [Acidobacteria bacterium]|nr:MAG: ABC transporter permease [Acidobacteriota bacterium]
MAIPIAYNFRNLVVRKTTTVMTALGIALTVAVLLAILALIAGLRSALHATGNPLQVLLLRKGSDSELVSNFSRQGFQDIKFKPGIARSKSGEPLASLEMVTVINLVSVDAPDGINVTVRGLTPTGIELREGLKLADGRWFDPGKREVVVGKSIAKRFPEARLGHKLRFGTGDWEVVGVMSAGQSAANSEILVDLNQLSSDFHRTEVLSSALLRATDPVAADALVKDLTNDQKLNVHALLEKDYYEAQTTSARPIEYLGLFVSIIMAIGSAFAAMNTMYAAVARRAREVGTLRVLGFSRASILVSFFTESVLLAALGGLIGIVLVLPLNGVTTGIGNFRTFSETSFNFQVTPEIMVRGMVFAMVLGAFGGLFPAWSAAKKEILTALRQV